MRRLPSDLEDSPRLVAGVAALCDAAGVPSSLVTVMSFAPGKQSRRRGAVPGVATLTVAHAAHADALCNALPVRRGRESESLVRKKGSMDIKNVVTM